MPIGNAEDETGSSYSLSLYDEATVIAGSDKASAYNHYTPYRVDACQNRDYNYVLIERCTHDDHIYEYKDATTHFAHCKYCFHSDAEEHEVVDGVCIKCEFAGYDVHILSENGSGEEDHDHIDADNGVNLRKADAIKTGTFFRGSFLCLRSSLKNTIAALCFRIKSHIMKKKEILQEVHHADLQLFFPVCLYRHHLYGHH